MPLAEPLDLPPQGPAPPYEESHVATTNHTSTIIQEPIMQDDAVLVEREPPLPNVDSAEPQEADESRRQTHIHDVPDNLKAGGAAAVPEAKHVIASGEAALLSKAAADPSTNSIGWDDDPDNVPTDLVKGLANDGLWLLIRRFNGQTQHVKSIPRSSIPTGHLDLEVSLEEEFSPDKLRTQIERIYYTVFIGLAGFAKHLARLRSWNEVRRSSIWCACYFTAWAFNLVMPAFFVLLAVLILHPPARPIVFPPAPIAAINSKTGNVQTPKAGSLKSTDSLTGADEKHKGEAVEREASNFVASFATLALGSALGKSSDKDDGEHAAKADKKVPDPTNLLAAASDAKQDAAGADPPPSKDPTKEPIMDAMWKNVRPVQRLMSDTSDGWERFANVLSPTLPFRDDVRLKLAGIVAGLFLASLVIPPGLVARGISFGAGFGFFGQPLITRGIHWLNVNVPNWPQYLELRNTLLLGVPTNAQLTLTLLRLGEAEKTPLPPPPIYAESPENAKDAEADIPSDYEIDEDESDDEHDRVAAAQKPEGVPPEQLEKAKQKPGRKIVNAMKTFAKGGVSTALGVDRVKASAGSEHAKQRLGALPGHGNPEERKIADGPSHLRSMRKVYKCRFHGKKGYLIISTAATTPCVSFIYQKLLAKDEAAFSVQLIDIKELKKVGGLGFKSKLVVGAVLGQEVADGLVIVDNEGTSHYVTAIHRRNELFNRLIAMPATAWESW